MTNPTVTALQKLVAGLEETNWSSWQTLEFFWQAFQDAKKELVNQRARDRGPDLLREASAVVGRLKGMHVHPSHYEDLADLIKEIRGEEP